MHIGFKTLRNVAVVGTMATLSSCASLASSVLPAGLGDALGQVTGLSDAIGGWKSTLGSTIDAAGLGQLSDFVGQAGNIGTTLSGYKDQLTGAMSDPFGAITDGIGDMAGIDVSSLTNMGNDARSAAVDQFADSASNVGELATSFLEQFGG